MHEDSGCVRPPSNRESITDNVISRLIEDGVPCESLPHIRWNDVDWRTGSLTLRRQCDFGCLLGLTVGLANRQDHRRRNLSEPSVSILASLRERQMLARIRSGGSWHPSECILTQTEGELPSHPSAPEGASSQGG